MFNRLVIIVFIFLVSGCAGVVKTKIIYPGGGVGAYVLNKTRGDTVTKEEDGVFLTFNKGRELTSVFVTSPLYRTDKGIAVGDKRELVLRVYGDSTISDMPIRQGEKIIGSLGQALTYPGIKFIINDEIVSGILVYSNIEECNPS